MLLHGKISPQKLSLWSPSSLSILKFDAPNSKLKGQPFDTVKVRMQTLPEQYSGVMPSTLKIVKDEGKAALWKGSVPTAGGMILENCMAFGINEALKRAFPDDPEELEQNGPPSLFKPFLMGSITGCFSATVLLPSEIIKAKTQVEVKATSSQEILRTMLKRQGVKSLFVGFDAQLMRDGPFYAFFFGGRSNYDGYVLSCPQTAVDLTLLNKLILFRLRAMVLLLSDNSSKYA